jgi:phosphatidylinositol-bisphosphatase
MAETLIRFLESLADPVLPASIYQQCLDASASYSACRTLIGAHLSSVHYNVFYYLMSFLREILCYSEKNKLTPERLAVLFSSVLLCSPDPHARPTEATIKKKADFVLHFLLEEGGQRDYMYK